MNFRVQNQESHKSFKVARYQKRAVFRYKYIFKNLKNPFQLFLALSIALSVNLLLVDIDNKAMAASSIIDTCESGEWAIYPTNIRENTDRTNIILKGNCRKADGTMNPAEISLSTHIKNENGALAWTIAGQEFRGGFNDFNTCGNIRIEQPFDDKFYLKADCLDREGTRIPATINLNEKITNQNGNLVRKENVYEGGQPTQACISVPGQPGTTRCL